MMYVNPCELRIWLDALLAAQASVSHRTRLWFDLVIWTSDVYAGLMDLGPYTENDLVEFK